MAKVTLRGYLPFFLMVLWVSFSLIALFVPENARSSVDSPYLAALATFSNKSDLNSKKDSDEIRIAPIQDFNRETSVASTRVSDETDQTDTRRRRIGELPDEPFDMSKYDTIFFFHARKAGGTSIRKWLNNVVNKHNLTLVAPEAIVLEDFQFNNHTLYVTSLRDPVERIVSSYWFEGRWPIGTSYEDRTDENGIDLRDWMKIIDKGLNLRNKKKLYHCASNCYCKWFGSHNRHRLNTNVELAMERLERFDLVIQTERLASEEYRESLKRLLDAQEHGIGHKRKGNKMPGGNNSNTTYSISAEDMEYLNELNKNDKELYSNLFEFVPENERSSVDNKSDLDYPKVSNNTRSVPTQDSTRESSVASTKVSDENNKADSRPQRIGQLPDEPFDMSKYDTIFFFHARKAGGTSIRKWLNNVVNKHNLTLVAPEAIVLEDFKFNSHTLYVTSLRDPVERIISSYWFEGRWPIGTAYENRTDDNGIDLRDWMKIIDKGLNLRKKKKLYHCASNCYCKWFGSNNRRRLNTDIAPAMERLERFDLVIQTERLASEEYRESLKKLLDAQEHGIGHKRKGNKMPGGNNSNTTYSIPEEDMEYLNELNKNDKELYSNLFG